MKNFRTTIYSLLLVSLFLAISANVSGQNVKIKNFTVENATLEECLKKIKEYTGLGYLANDARIKQVDGITVSLKNSDVNSVMEAILAGSGFSYQINNNVILILRVPPRDPQHKRQRRSFYEVSGIVRSHNDGEPLFFATVFVNNTNRYTTTDENGAFTFMVPSGNRTISVFMQGYETVEKNFDVDDDIGEVHFLLREQNLALDEVIVIAETTQSRSGSSTYRIGEQAIQQVQPVSVKEILQLLPGAKISNPDLTQVSQISLRSAAPENTLFANAESFGTSVIIDGARISNDGNMQADNPAVGTTGGKNVVNRGVDLRQISAATIESVEVVEGVANAKYGNLTSGAVIIKRKAGETPLTVGFNAFPSSYQISSSKGFQTEKSGSFNFNADYVLANSSPVDRKNYYQRVNAGTKWTYLLSKELNWTNTLSYDLSYQLDGTRFEPEEIVSSHRKSHQSNHLLNIYGALDLKGRLSYTLNSSYFSQYSLLDDYRSDGPIATIESMEPGIYITGFTPIAYRTTTEMLGRPLNVQFNVDHEQTLTVLKNNLSLNYGFDFNYDKNFGKGRNIVGNAVVTSGTTPGNRAANFHDVPASAIYSGYLQSDISREFNNLSYIAKIGLRYDNMIGRHNLFSPRLALSTKLFDKIRLRAAWGLSYKAPSMITLYPGPSFIDIINFDHFSNNVAERMAIVSTFIEQPDNSHLKPSRGETLELGLDFEHKEFRINFTLYRKLLTDGVASAPYLKIYPNQSFKVIDRPVGELPIVIKDTVANFPRVLYEYNNSLNTQTDGFTFHATLPKISATNTRVSFSGAFNNTFTENNAPRISSSVYAVGTQENRFGRYTPISYRYKSFTTNITVVQHIPVIKLLVTFILEQNWLNERTAYDTDLYPIGYYDLSGDYFVIPESERRSPEYANLVLEPTNFLYFPEPPYSNFHLQLRKETKQGHSFSFFANNFWWHNPKYYDEIKYAMIRKNGSVSFGLGVTFTL